MFLRSMPEVGTALTAVLLADIEEAVDVCWAMAEVTAEVTSAKVMVCASKFFERFKIEPFD